MNKDISRGAPIMNKLKHTIGKTLRPGGPDRSKLKSLNLSQLGRNKISKSSKNLAEFIPKCIMKVTKPILMNMHSSLHIYYLYELT
jgi:hypothetical protein